MTKVLIDNGHGCSTSGKRSVGILWHMVTGKSGEYMRRFCSNRSKYNNNHTKKDVERLNHHLETMKISGIRL